MIGREFTTHDGEDTVGCLGEFAAVEGNISIAAHQRVVGRIS